MEPTDFDTVFASYEKPILGFVLQMVRDESVAEDLTQEIFLKVHRSLPGFEGRSKLSTWVYRIATKACLDHFRSSSHKKGERTDALEGDVPAGSLDEAARSGVVPLEERVVKEEMGGCVREFVDDLPEDYRAVVVLHDLQGFKNREIAEILECSIGAVKIRLHRARTKLKASLAGGCSFYRDGEDVLRCDRKDPEPADED